MNPFREYLENAKATKHLRPPYQILTTAIGFIAVLAGIVVWYRCTEVVATVAGTPFDQPIQSTSQVAVAAAWLFVGLPGAVPCRCAASRLNRRANGRVRQAIRPRRVVLCPSIQVSPVMVQCTGRCLTTHSSRLRFAARL